MLGGSSLTRTVSGDGAATEAAPEPQGSGELGGGGGGGGGSTVTLTGAFSEEDKASGGNRWPRQETLALLKIRSDMDVVFRDSSLKGPLWEQVSRKMAELGYHRNAKKCKEKFENVYKYHKRTKDGRTSKPDGKSYRFFDQLNALENITTSPSVQLALPPPSPLPRPPQAATPITMSVTPIQAVNVSANAQVTVSSTPNIAAVSVAQNTPPHNFSNLMNSSFPPPTAIVANPTQTNTVAAPQLNISTSFLSNSSFSSSSATSSDDDIERRHKRKRKLKDFFEKVMKEVVEKQEDLQKDFLEKLEKRERDRMIREEAWRVQEMARIHREHDLLVQERSMAAARESALIGFLQKMSDQQNSQSPQNPNATPVRIPVLLAQPLPPPPPPQQATTPLPIPVPSLPPITTMTTTTTTITTTTPVLSPEPLRSISNNPRNNNGCDDFLGARISSRWPKAEVQALINLRTTLDNKYQENGPKGPLWEEISSGMKRLGYNRSSKRCKEKWENINKYFKKVKESNKKRPEDAKTCPYFHQLDALYKERAITNPAKPEDAMVPIMARPEQQWPLPQVVHQQQQQHLDEHEGDNIDQHDDDGDDNDDDGDEDDEEDDEGMGYEIVTNKGSSVATSTA